MQGRLGELQYAEMMIESLIDIIGETPKPLEDEVTCITNLLSLKDSLRANFNH